MNEIEIGHRKLLIKYLLDGPARILSTSFGLYLILCGISNVLPCEHPNGWPEVIRYAIGQVRDIYEESKNESCLLKNKRSQ